MSRVYVGTYEKYNNGSISGAWLDLEDYADYDEFMAACAELHIDEESPELMFQDWEDIPDDYISESSIEPELWDWLSLDEDDREMLAAFREDIDQSGTLEQARDAFQGTAESEEDYAYQYVEECGLLDSLPENLQCYFDYERFARDLFINDLSFVYRNGTGYVFSRY